MISVNVSRIFRRGQIWYWKDPEYQDKSKKRVVPSEVAGTRYSRYVLILQDVRSDNRGSILCVPISTRDGCPHDVRIQVSHLYVTKYCYAKVDNMFPAHPHCLTTYVCEIDKAALAIINGEIIKMLIPEIAGEITHSTVSINKYINMVNETCTEEIHTELIRNIQAFIRMYIHETDDELQVINMIDVKSSFDDFCVNNRYNCIGGQREFVKLFIEAFNSMEDKNWRIESVSEHTMDGPILFPGLCLEWRNPNEPANLPTSKPQDEEEKEEEKPDDPPESDELTTFRNQVAQLPRTKTGRFKWSEEGAMNLFITGYDKFGKEVVMDAFNVNAKTAAHYYGDFRKFLGMKKGKQKKPKKTYSEQERIDFLKFYDKYGAQLTAKRYGMTYRNAHQNAKRWRAKGIGASDNKPAPPPPPPANNDPTSIPVDDHILYGISLMSNVLREHLEYYNIFGTLRLKVSDNAFWKKINAALYYSIIKLCKIDTDAKPVIIPTIKTDHPLAWFYQFLMRLSEEKNFANDDYNWDDIKYSYGKLYGKDPCGIPGVYLDVLKEKMISLPFMNGNACETVTTSLKSFVVQ